MSSLHPGHRPSASAPDERLLPGETAYVTIPTGHAEDVLEIPNAALTYTTDLPEEEMDGLYRRFAIPPAARTSHIGGQQVVWKLAAGGGSSWWRSRPGSPITPARSSSRGISRRAICW